MVKAQHLDAVIHGPFDQPAADILAELELQRNRTGQFDRPRHPQVLSGAGGEQRIAAILVVEQHPEAGASGGDASGCLDRQYLESGNARQPRFVRREILQLGAMIDGERHQTRDHTPARRRPMDVVQHGVLAQRPLRAAVIEEMLQLGPGRIFRRAEEPRHRERPAGVGPGRGRGEVLPAQPAAEETGHEGVARSEHVEHFDRESLADDSGFNVVGDRPLIDDAALGAALEHDGGAGDRANGLERGQHVVGAPRDHDLLLRADDQVAVGEHRPEALRHRLGLHVALESRRVAGEPPEIGSVVDVENHPSAMPPGQRDRLGLRRGSGRFGEMRSGHDDGAASGDEALVDVAFIQRHVGAVRAIENHRRDALAFHGKQHKRRQALPVDMHSVDGDAFANKLFADEAAHLLGAHARDQGRLEPEPRRSDRDIGRAATHRLCETPDVLELAPDLLAVEVDGRAADADHIEALLKRGAIGHLPPHEIPPAHLPVAPWRPPRRSGARDSDAARHQGRRGQRHIPPAGSASGQ